MAMASARLRRRVHEPTQDLPQKSSGAQRVVDGGAVTALSASSTTLQQFLNKLSVDGFSLQDTLSGIGKASWTASMSRFADPESTITSKRLFRLYPISSRRAEPSMDEVSGLLTKWTYLLSATRNTPCTRRVTLTLSGSASIQCPCREDLAR
eukprot:scaffold1156_cov394-Prasinococcus_capsulatus_cf.AAC.14